MADDALHRVIGTFYDAAAEPELWPDAMRQAMTLWDATTFVAQVQASGRDGTEIVATNWSTDALDLYARHYWKHDLWTEKGCRLPPLRPNRGDELLDPRVMERSEIYNELAKPHLGGLFHMLGGTALVGGAVGMMGLHRPRDAPAFSVAEQRRMGLLLPHFQRALRHRLGAAAARERTALAALDSLPTGVIVVTAGGAMIFANRAAEAMARARDGLTLGGRGRPVGAALASESRAMQALIAAAARQGQTASAFSGGALCLSRPSGRRAYGVLVAPLPRSLDGGESYGRVILLVSDPEREPRPPADLLRQLCGLTAREAELAALLAGGRSLDEAADRLGLARESARTYLKRIFVKTETARQSELASLLLRIAGVGPW